MKCGRIAILHPCNKTGTVPKFCLSLFTIHFSLNIVYSQTQLEFLRTLAKTSDVSQRRYDEADVRVLADLMLKEAAWNNWQDWKNWGYDLGKGALNVVGDGGWGWDTGQNAAGNLAGYGGMIGSILGSTGGAVAGSAALPGVGTAAGGVAGGVAGGAAGRGLGYALGSGIDWFMGNKPGENQKGFLQTTFDPGTMLGDGVFGLLPGAGKGLQTAWRGVAGVGKQAVKQHLEKQLGREVTEKAVQNFMNRTGRFGTAKALARGETKDQLARWGMQAYKPQPGAGLMQQGFGRAKNFAQNMGRAVSTKAGRRELGREGANLAKWGVPLSMAGSAAAQTTANQPGATGRFNPFTNTQGFTQVVGNKNRGLSGVQAMTPDAYRLS